MRYRQLDQNGDYSFGRGSANFYVNSPEAVAQAIRTRLLLFQGEFFLDTSEGTPYLTQILGAHTQGTRDAAIRARILGTPGVLDIASYSSTVDAASRTLTVACTVTTAYGQSQVAVPLGSAPVTVPGPVVTLPGPIVGVTGALDYSDPAESGYLYGALG